MIRRRTHTSELRSPKSPPCGLFCGCEGRHSDVLWVSLITNGQLRSVLDYQVFQLNNSLAPNLPED